MRGRTLSGLVALAPALVFSAARGQPPQPPRTLPPAVTQAGFAQPVAFAPDDFREPLLKAARRGPLLSLDGVLVRDWDPDTRRTWPGVCFGLRLYELEGVRFAWVHASHSSNQYDSGTDFFVVDRGDYRRLYRLAQRCRRDAESECPPLKLSVYALPIAPPRPFMTTKPTIHSTTTRRRRR